MKSKPYFLLIALLSLLLGLSLGHMHFQHRQIEKLTSQKALKQGSSNAFNSHHNCFRMAERQHLRCHIDHYRQALKELSNTHLVEPTSTRVFKIKTVQVQRR